MRKTVLFSLFLAVASASHGISEIDYAKNYAAHVEPNLRAAQKGTFRGRDNLEIAYLISRTSPSRGKILVVPGFSESYLKYAELIYDLNQKGYSVYILDHRGQGLSGRKVANTQIIHVDNFHYYVDDLEKFVRDHVLPDHPEEPMFVIGCSMGGWISGQLMARQPTWFKGASLVAPMFRINTGRIPRYLARRIAGTAHLLGRSKRFAWGYGEVDITKETFANGRTHSYVRWEQRIKIGIAHPRIVPGGPSYGWVRQALKVTHSYRIENMAEKVKTPTLILEAGQDIRVKSYGAEVFCEAAEDCSRVLYKDSYHGILSETDSIREDAINRTLHFFEAQ